MRKTRVGVIGVGTLGYRHAFTISYRIPNAALAAVCCRTAEKAVRVAEELEAQQYFTDHLDLVNCPEIDAVVIASNSTAHPGHIKDALAAGKHVFCEKPLAMTPETCRELETVVEAHPQQIFFPGFMRRYDKSYRYAKDMMLSGEMGKPILVRCHSADPAISAGRLIPIAGSSGGLFLDLGVHDFDLAGWFLNSRAITAYAVGGCHMLDGFAKYGDIDNAVAVLRYESGGIGMFFESRTAAHGYHIETEIVCEKGMLRIGAVPELNRVVIMDDKRAGHACHFDFLERFADSFTDEMQAFVNCVQSGTRPENTVYDSTNATLAAIGAHESRLSGQVAHIQ